VALFLLPHSALAKNYVKPDTFKQWLTANRSIVIVDIQPARNFADRHFKGSLETDAFPAKSAEEKKRLDKVLPKIQSAKGEVVIVCPKGKGGAVNTYEYLQSRGVPESRLFILEDGMDGWPYPDIVVKGR
jgi:rhodanese-related sulfurtransferase